MVLLVQCIVCCILFTLMVMPSLYKNPINWVMDFPPEIIKRVESLPQYKDKIKKKEKRHIKKKILAMIAFVVVLSAVAYFSGCRSFLDTFLHVFIIFVTVNLYDLVVLDWGIACHSKKIRIQGTEDMDKEYNNPWFHSRGFIIGCVLGLIVALLSGVVVQLISLL